jgi:hypothetical protein
LCHIPLMTTIKRLIEKEQAGNAQADNRLRCFAINNFGDAQHPYAEASNLDGFVAAYVRKCLRKCAASARVNDNARARAKELAK